MSTAAVSTNPLQQDLQTYFQDRQTDLQQLGQALTAGDVSGAQQDYDAIQTLAQNGPLTGGEAFAVNQREQDFTSIGQSLQSGDLAGAQQAFAALQSTFTSHRVFDPPATGGPAPVVQPVTADSTATTAASASTSAAAVQEIVLNLAAASGSTPEQITINLNNTSSGAEQVTIGVGSQLNPNAQDFTFNLAQNANEQIVLNLLGNTASSSSSSSSQTSGVNVVA
jgi:hypothetical protein